MTPFPRRMSPAYSGIVLILLASLFWSLNGALIKVIHQESQGPGGVAIAFYRSLVAGLFLLPFALGRWSTLFPIPDAPRVRRLRMPRPAALWCMVFFTVMTVSFVVANTLTTAASVIIIQYTSTFWIFGLSPLILGERPRSSDLGILLLAFAGVVVIFAGDYLLQFLAGRPSVTPLRGVGHTAGASKLAGLTLALASGLFYGLLTMMLRRLRDADSVAVTVFNNLGSAVLLFPVVLLVGQIAVSPRSLLLLVFMGVVQFGIPYYLYTLGLVRVPAYHAALITLVEPVLVPLWTYLAVGEGITLQTAVGGAMILGALILFLQAARVRRPQGVESAT